MSLFISIQTELIKIRRSAALWLTVLGAGMIPFIFFLAMIIKPNSFAKRLEAAPWDSHILQLWQAFSAFLLPMFVILICSLVLQIEYKNNAWKQVFASPQTLGNIFFSKLITVVLMIVLLIMLFNLFTVLSAWLAGALRSQLPFLSHGVPWLKIVTLSGKTLLSLLAIVALQYWFSLRFRNFIVPIGIGLALLIVTMVAMNWEHIDKLPYAFPFLTFNVTAAGGAESGMSTNFFWYSIVYFMAVTLLAFLDMRWRKERG